MSKTGKELKKLLPQLKQARKSVKKHCSYIGKKYGECWLNCDIYPYNTERRLDEGCRAEEMLKDLIDYIDFDC